eukprot:g7164.t1
MVFEDDISALLAQFPEPPTSVAAASVSAAAPVPVQPRSDRSTSTPLSTARNASGRLLRNARSVWSSLASSAGASLAAAVKHASSSTDGGGGGGGGGGTAPASRAEARRAQAARGAVFGVALAELQCSTRSFDMRAYGHPQRPTPSGAWPGSLVAGKGAAGLAPLPDVLARLGWSFFQLGGLREEGVFRIAAEQRQLAAIAKRLDRGESADACLEAGPFTRGAADAHVVATLLKLVFRKLPAPLLAAVPGDALSRWAGEGGADADATALVREHLPQAELSALLFLLDMMCSVAHTAHTGCTRMTPLSLATVFAPTLCPVRVPTLAPPPTAVGSAPRDGRAVGQAMRAMQRPVQLVRALIEQHMRECYGAVAAKVPRTAMQLATVATPTKMAADAKAERTAKEEAAAAAAKAELESAEAADAAPAAEPESAEAADAAPTAADTV